MSAALYPVLKDSSRVATAVDGKALSRASDLLDQLALTGGVTPLTHFVSLDSDEYGVLEDADVEPSGPTWFPAADGLKTVRHLLQVVGNRAKTDEPLLADLRALETVLAEALERHVEWHLAIDL